MNDIFIHPTAIVENGAVIGTGTRIWAHVHIRPGVRIGDHCNIGDGVFVEDEAVVGSRVTIKNQAVIWKGVTIEDDCFIGPGVMFTNDLLPRSPRMPEAVARYARESHWLCKTLVKQGAAIGAGAIVLSNLEIGEYAMIGAGALVTRPVPRHALFAGNPARFKAWICRCGQKLDRKNFCTACQKTVQLQDAK